MSVLVDTSILIDYLRGHQQAADILVNERASDALHASEISRLEVLAGMRPAEEHGTRAFLSTMRWHSLDEQVAEKAGEFGRSWLASHRVIDGADLAVAATAVLLEACLITLNVKHFPMFAGLRRPY